MSSSTCDHSGRGSGSGKVRVVLAGFFGVSAEYPLRRSRTGISHGRRTSDTRLGGTLPSRMAGAADLTAPDVSAAYRYRLRSSGDGFHVPIRTPAIKRSLD